MAKKNLPKGPIARLMKKIHVIFGRNIATAAFGALMLYMVGATIMYASTSKVESYMVNSGQLSRNEIFTGLVVREETLVQANSSGYMNYYAREGDKINANGVVFGLSPEKQLVAESTLSQEDLAKVREEKMSFSKGFSTSNFGSTYSFKYQVEDSIMQYAGITGSKDSGDAVTYGNQTLNKAAEDGIVLYSKDSCTGKTLEDLTTADFDETAYRQTSLKSSDPVRTGTDVYTLITDERWSLVIPLTEKRANRLSDRTSMRVRFLKDDMTQTGDFSIIEIDGNPYAKIDFSKGLIRYATDRFLEVELVTNTAFGLKIPLSAIATKQFYAIPSTYAANDYSSTTNTFYVTTRTKDGKSVEQEVSAAVYSYEANEVETNIDGEEIGTRTYTLYVDCSAFHAGDVLKAQDGSKSKFTIGEKGSIEGVYCTNQGYTVFRKIVILDENEEYAIVSKNTSYGISRYDHIVKNADMVQEGQFLY